MARPTKEQTYLKENPEATPYDMLMAQAITQERYDELNANNGGNATQTADQFAAAQKELKPTQTADEFAASNKLIPKVVIQHRTKPKTERIIQNTSAQVYLHNKQTGKNTSMARGAAERMVKKYPQTFTIS